MFAKKLFKTINDRQIIFFIAIQGRREGGKGENDPGAHGLQEGHRLQRAHELERGPIEMTLRNQHAKPEDFFFGEHLISTGKTVRISVKTFFVFFGDHIIFRTKLTENPLYLSWPRAHFWSPAAL